MRSHWLEQQLADVPEHDDWLGSREHALLKKLRFAKRRADWRLGRWTAKSALAAYCEIPHRLFSELEIIPERSGAPAVLFREQPFPISISLSHRNGVGTCIVSEHTTEIGCDLEAVEPRTDTFIYDYLAQPEQDLMEEVPEFLRTLVVTILWSGKESVLKAIRQGLRASTMSVVVQLTDPLEEFPGTSTTHASTPKWRRFSAIYDRSTRFQGGWFENNNLIRTFVGPECLSFPPVQISGGSRVHACD